MKYLPLPLEAQLKGYSLLELMVVLAIVSILVLIAGQTFPVWMGNAQTRDASDSFRSSLSFARSESITHGGNVRLCGSRDGVNCADSLDDGWLVYHDADGDLLLSASDRVLLWQEQDHRGVAVAAVDAGGTTASGVGFNYRGYPTAGLTVSLVRGVVSRRFVLHGTGRVERL